MRVAYYVAVSLDGRIAGPAHDLSFLQTLEGGPEGYGYDEFIAGIDGLVVGASSWDFMKDYGWMYGDRPVWVLSHREDVPVVEGADMRVFSGDVGELVAELEAAGLEHVWVIGGGNVVGQFLAVDRLDELIVTVAPTFLGRGPSLADGEFPLRRFTLVGVERREGASSSDTSAIAPPPERASKSPVRPLCRLGVPRRRPRTSRAGRPRRRSSPR